VVGSTGLCPPGCLGKRIGGGWISNESFPKKVPVTVRGECPEKIIFCKAYGVLPWNMSYVKSPCGNPL